MKQNKIPRPVGSSIRFKCKATGVPQPEVRWLKDGQIWVSEDIGSYQDSRLRWTLKINDLQQKDSGKYTCIVTNLHGTINYTYTLEVVGTDKQKNSIFQTLSFIIFYLYYTKFYHIVFILLYTGSLA